MEKYKGIVKKMLTRLGYEVIKIDNPKQRKINQPDLVLYPYVKEDGSFDYESYRRIQTQGNKQKIDLVWVNEDNIAFLANYIKNHTENPKFGICHGTRRGKEQEWFRKYLNCEVIGTEISDTALQFPNTIQWDFHETKPEWIEKVDFIYSNSYDHSYDPEKCLNAWMSCLKKDRLCIIEFSSNDEPFKGDLADPLDPFRVRLPLLIYLITIWGKGRYGVRELLKAPGKSKVANFIYFIVIQKF